MNTNTSEQFRSAMRRAGLEHDGLIAPDGKLHRFRASGDTKPNSWFVFFPDPPAAGVFGCWKRGIKETWCQRNSQELSQNDWRRIRARLAQADRERERVEAERQAQARRLIAQKVVRGAFALHGLPASGPTKR